MSEAKFTKFKCCPAPSSWEITVQMKQWPASHAVQLVWADSSSDHTDSQSNLLPAPSCLDLEGGLRTRDIGQRAQCTSMRLELYATVIIHQGSICLFPRDNALPFHNAWPRTRRLESQGVGINGSIQGKIQQLLTKIESRHFNLSLKRILETKHKATCNSFGCQHVWKNQHFKKPSPFCLGLTYIKVRQSHDWQRFIVIMKDAKLYLGVFSKSYSKCLSPLKIS